MLTLPNASYREGTPPESMARRERFTLTYDVGEFNAFVLVGADLINVGGQ